MIAWKPVAWMALSDGAGNAQSVAKRALGLLETWMGDASLAHLLRDETWMGWAKKLDSVFVGGPEATLVAAAVVGDQLIGVCVGDSRAYVVPVEGDVRFLTAAASEVPLGSGEAEPLVFHASLAARDVLLLVSDGAWAPLGAPGLERAVRSIVVGQFAELPSTVLDAASRHGLTDDMTVVALRIVQG